MSEYIRFPKEGFSKQQVIQAIKEVGKLGAIKPNNGPSDFNEMWKKDPLNENQNSSPTIREFFQMADELGEDRIRFIGYMIVPPRSDYRVTVEGFRGIDLSAEEALELMSRYGDADEKDYGPRSFGMGGDGDYWVRFWWD